MKKIKLSEIVKFLISIIACQLAGFIGSFFTTPAIPTWYATLNKPSFTPPNAVFAPVWTTLFLLMGIALFLVWRKGLHLKNVRIAVIIFGIQLILNMLWSIMFFGLKSPLAGFIEIVIMWIAICFTIFYFYKTSKVSGLLLIPYILWVSFAMVLNYSIWRLNP